jgi:hypothetical protein
MRCVAAVAGGLGDDRRRVWENAVEGDKSSVMKKVMAMRFKEVSPSTDLGSNHLCGAIVPKTNAAGRMTPKPRDLVAR